MPIPLLAEGFWGNLSIPYGWTILKSLPFVFVGYLLKLYFGGAKCQSERNMYSKVVMVTVSEVEERKYETKT